jgi:hypothetical protein
MVDNLIAVYEPIIYKMWEPRRVTTLWVPSAYYRDSFTFFMLTVLVVLKPFLRNRRLHYTNGEFF